jgi:hypothetical protein
MYSRCGCEAVNMRSQARDQARRPAAGEAVGEDGRAIGDPERRASTARAAEDDEDGHSSAVGRAARATAGCVVQAGVDGVA